MTTSINLGIPYISPNQSQPDVTHNDALVMIQVLLSTGVWQVGLNTPPGSPENGDAYIVGTSPTGVWVGKENCIAAYYQDQWYYVPGFDSDGTQITMSEEQVGLMVWSKPDGDYYIWTDTGSPSVLAWTASGLGGSLTGVNIKDDNSSIVSAATAIDFAGAGVVVTDDGGNEALVTIEGGIQGIEVGDGGSPQVVTAATAIDFVGTAVTSVVDSGGGLVTVTLTDTSGGGGGTTGVDVSDGGSPTTVVGATTIDFVGTAVASVVDSGGGVATVTINDTGGGGSIEVSDGGSPEVVSEATAIDFTGSAVSVVDAGGGRATVAVSSITTLSGLQVAPERYTVNENESSLSSSAYATKGNTYDVSADIQITNVAAEFGTDGSATYKVVLATVTNDGVNDPITAILGESGTQSAPASDNEVLSFDFNPPIHVSGGTAVAVMVVRTDGTSTSIAEVVFPVATDQNALFGRELAFAASIRYASTDPQVSDNTYFSGTTAVKMGIQYIRNSDISELTGGVQVGDGGSPETVGNATQIDFIGDVSVVDSGGGLATVTVGAGVAPYDFGVYFSGQPTASQEIFRMKAVRAFTIADGAPGSTANARVESTGSAVFSVRKNGSQFATVTWSAGSPTNYDGTWAFDVAADESIVAGDELTIVAPSSADATLEDISIFVKGTRD
jgi:hypothetical protein